MGDPYLAHIRAKPGDISPLLDGDRSVSAFRDLYQASSSPLILPIPSQVQASANGLVVEPQTSRRSRSSSERSGKGRGRGRGRGKPKTGQRAAKRRKIAEVVSEGQPGVLGLFGSCDSTTYGPATSSATDLNDVLLFCGGPVWAMDWCPAVSDSDGNEANLQYLAVAAHPKDKSTNAFGSPVTGKGILQIWEIAHKPGIGQDMAPLPKMIHAICHEHGLIWDLKWCPLLAGQFSTDDRLGILAVLFGDGQIDLFAIPKVGQVYEDPEQSNRIVLDLSSQAEMSQLEYTKMRPQVSLPAEEAPSLGSCLEWLPSPPHDLILVGCWTGSVFIVRIPPDGPGSQKLEVLTQILADSSAIRSVCWAPAEIAENVSDMSQRHLFITAGHSASIKMWDTRDPFQPVMDVPTQISWILDASWLYYPAGVLFCQDDGSLRFLELSTSHRAVADRKDKQQLAWWGATSGTLWSCHVNAISGHTAYGGDSGQVAIAFPVFQHKTRSRPPHIVVSSTRQEGDIIKMSTQDPPAQVSAVRPLSVKGEFPDPINAVCRVRWGNASAQDPQGTWLASGAKNGLVRCQRLSFYVTY